MSDSSSIIEILSHFPGVNARDIVPLGNAGGFSGACLWKISTPDATLCLRKWPRPHPSKAALCHIHGLLRHAASQGMTELPAPLLHRGNDTVLDQNHALYELTPWMPGQADYHARPNPRRLTAAMSVLAQFHAAVRSHPMGHNQTTRGVSPGLIERQAKLERLLHRDFDRLTAAVAGHAEPEIRERGQRLLGMFPSCAGNVRQRLAQAASLKVALQPCIRDIWHDHVLFSDDIVTGLIDFGAMRTDNVAGDLARLIGSLVGDIMGDWSAALQAYETQQPLTVDEHVLIRAFDQSGVLMSGLSWLQWICIDGRQFDDQSRVLRRLDENLVRMEHLRRSV